MLTAQDVRVGQRAALGIQKEQIALAGRELLNVIGGDSVQQTSPVVATHADLAARRKIDPRGGFTQCFVTVHVVEVQLEFGEFNTSARLLLQRAASKSDSDS